MEEGYLQFFEFLMTPQQNLNNLFGDLFGNVNQTCNLCHKMMQKPLRLINSCYFSINLYKTHILGHIRPDLDIIVEKSNCSTIKDIQFIYVYIYIYIPVIPVIRFG